MGVSKLKSLIIAALAVINVIFLIVIIADSTADLSGRRQAIENACAVLEKGGISVNPAGVVEGKPFSAQKASRGNAAEMAIAEAVLGPSEIIEQGVIYQYVNEQTGTAVFYSGGEFEINLNEGAVPATGGTLKTAERLLRDMGLEISELFLSGRAGSETITAVCAYKERSIFNCTIRFTFSDGNIETIAGRYVTGIEADPEGAELSSAGTALLTFLAAVKRGDFECTRIDGAEPGYQLREVGSFGAALLTPAWLITADSGRYILDTATEEIRLLPLAD